MTVEEIRGSFGDEIDRFPVGMRVLAVDDDPTCLKLLEGLLRKCQYHVTTTSQARIALKMLRENRNRFDIVISDVHMPDMDGFKLLELVGLEMDLPVIMLSANSDAKLVMKGITHGACDYLVKPVRLEELRNIWQHVIRRKKIDPKSKNKSMSQEKGIEGGGNGITGSSDHNGKINRKRKDEEEDGEDMEDDPSTQKKPRVVWSIELHRKFVAAVNQLGIEKAVPKRILDLMNVDGLTRENVASHLQKYRLYLKRISSVANQQVNIVAALSGKDSSPYMRIGSLDGFNDFRSYSGSARITNTPLTPYNPGGGMLGQLNIPAAGVNLRSLTSSSGLIQSNQPPNLITNSIDSLRKFQPVVLAGAQTSTLFQGIPASLELNSGGGFNGSSDFAVSKFPSNSSPLVESLNHNQLPIDFSLVSGQNQTWVDRNTQGSSNAFGTLNCQLLENNVPVALAENNGFSIRKMDVSLIGRSDSGSSYAHNSIDKLGVESRIRSNENYNLEQTKLFPSGYDSSLDDLMSSMIKREQDGTILMDGEFGFDAYSFGSCI